MSVPTEKYNEVSHWEKPSFSLLFPLLNPCSDVFFVLFTLRWGQLCHFVFQEELPSLELAYEPVSNSDIIANSG